MTLQRELSLEDLLIDPIIGLVMVRDGFAPEEIRRLMGDVAARTAEASPRPMQPDTPRVVQQSCKWADAA
jgi:hypothetical protein